MQILRDLKPSGTSVAMAVASASGLEQIYREMRGELLRFLAARLGDAAEAEEVTQDLYLRLGTVSAPVANGRAYIYRAAQNLALDRIRERRRRSLRETEWAGLHHPTSHGTEPSDTRGNAETMLIEREEAAALASAIAALPPGAGKVFHLHKLEGLPHAEVAARLGISRSGVEKHLAVAMAHLRRTLVDRP